MKHRKSNCKTHFHLNEYTFIFTCKLNLPVYTYDCKIASKVSVECCNTNSDVLFDVNNLYLYSTYAP